MLFDLNVVHLKLANDTNKWRLLGAMDEKERSREDRKELPDTFDNGQPS